MWGQRLRNKFLRVTPQICSVRICLYTILHACTQTTNLALRLPYCVTPLFKQSLPVLEYQPAVHLLCLMPRIRSRLTLRRRALLRNPYAFGGKDSHLSFRYSCQHSHFLSVHRFLQNDFNPIGTLLYHANLKFASTSSVSYFSPGHLRRRVTRPVSYYALFKWWLLLSQHPGCLCNPTSFAT